MSTQAGRVDRRLPLLCRGAVRTGGQSLPVTVRDLSSGGVQLCASAAQASLFVVGASVDLACHLPRTSAPVRLAIRIGWVRSGTDHRGEEATLVGASFGTLDERTRALV